MSADGPARPPEDDFFLFFYLLKFFSPLPIHGMIADKQTPHSPPLATLSYFFTLSNKISKKRMDTLYSCTSHVTRGTVSVYSHVIQYYVQRSTVLTPSPPQYPIGY